MQDRISNSTMFVSLLALNGILGTNGLNAILNYGDLKRFKDAFPPNNDKLEIPIADFTQLNASILDIFGEKGARPLLYNSGRMGVQVILKENPSLMGFVRLGFRALPVRKRAEKVLAVTSKQANKIFGENQRFSVTKDGFVTEIYDCFWCKGLKTSEPICHAEVGFETEAIKWATGGVEYDVREVSCVACGDKSCTFVAREKERPEEIERARA